jgi:predicted RNase H-like nuclease
MFGIDGCRGGWIVASADTLDETPTFQILSTFEAVVRLVIESKSIGLVDIPIGLCDHGRRCDSEARKMLRRRRASSVFTPPSRRAFQGGTKEEMRRLNIDATGRSLSEQSLAILTKIREVDGVMTPDVQRCVRETHPEVVFAALNGSVGLEHPKRVRQGLAERERLLPKPFVRSLEGRTFDRRQAGPDDYVDALAALVAAIRLKSGQGCSLPRGIDERDKRGLRMEICY